MGRSLSSHTKALSHKAKANRRSACRNALVVLGPRLCEICKSSKPARWHAICPLNGSYSPQNYAWFTDNEDVPGGPLLVVLSERFWLTRFNADPSIIGKNLTLSDYSFQVVGVVPAQINYWSPCDLYAPINSLELFYSGLRKRDEHPAACFGRLRPGVTLEQARAEIDTIHNSVIARYPETDKGYEIQVTAPGTGDYTVYDYSPAIWLLGAGVGCLLLISCANIANLLLALAFSRRKEMSGRAELGASRICLAEPTLLETRL